MESTATAVQALKAVVKPRTAYISRAAAAETGSGSGSRGTARSAAVVRKHLTSAKVASPSALAATSSPRLQPRLCEVTNSNQDTRRCSPRFRSPAPSEETHSPIKKARLHVAPASNKTRAVCIDRAHSPKVCSLLAWCITHRTRSF